MPDSADINGLTGFLREVAELTSLGTALQLAKEFGGFDRVYIPHQPSAASPLAICIGLEAARILAGPYGGTHQYVPRFCGPVKKPAIAQAQGSLREVARQFNVTTRYVRMVRNGREMDPRQGSLFEED